MLEDARDRGIVKIEIAVPDAINPRLSADLCAAYNLRQAIVVDRFDRTPDGSRLHQEDFTQALALPSEAKYEGTSSPPSRRPSSTVARSRA